MTITVRWFKHGHEQRNYWLRHGLMRLHRAGRIRYREQPLAAAETAGFSAEVIAHDHRHTTLLAVEDGASRVRCIVDSEDSFLCMAGIMHHADRVFVAGYNGAFFRKKRFDPPFDWLKPHEAAFYRQRAASLIETQGHVFDRVRPFVPIGPDTRRREPVSAAQQRLRNLHHKAAQALSGDLPWRFVLEDFEHRYASLLAQRNQPVAHDVVLLDTLWGWPRHRAALHERLGELAAAGRDIRSRLNWAEPSEWDGSIQEPLDPARFPMTTGAVTDYEAMLAASRLAVFASGFHWGWRNIMTLALLWGLPIHADRLFLEPWFPMDRFRMTFNDSADWDGLAAEMNRTTDAVRADIARHNQAAFDELLAPEKVADYFVAAALG